MITAINQPDVIAILAEYLHFPPKLKAGQFYINKSQKQQIVMWTQNPLFLDFNAIITEDVVSIGLPIFSIKKNNISLYPQFINCLMDDYENYFVETKLLIDVSYGKVIKVNNPNGICFLSNKLGHKVAFGEINNNIFYPLVDLGWYLRSGN